MKKIIYILPLMMMVMTTFVLACEVGPTYSLREAPTELKDVNFNSNGHSGSGYITNGLNGDARIVYQFQENNGIWTERTQVGQIRGNWYTITVNYNPVTGILSVPRLGLSVKTINLR